MIDFKDKKVLITGGTGFLATNLVKYLLNQGCQYIRLTSRDEMKQAQRFEEFGRDSRINYILSDVRDYKSTELSLKDIDICIHTAAYKRIDSGERSPSQFVQTNVYGTENVINACLKNNVDTAVFISSDKGCMPISLYGSTKFTAEKLWTYANQYSGSNGTKFTSVRYGNVWKSTGSIYHIFKKQYDMNQGYFTITHKDMSRFFMTVYDAIDTIMFAIDHTKGNGEIYVPKVPSFNVVDLAKAFCKDFDIEEIGLRGIEKMSEVLVAREEFLETNEMGDYFEILPIKPIHIGRSNYPHNDWDLCNSYTSCNNKQWLSINQLKDIIKKYDTY